MSAREPLAVEQCSSCACGVAVWSDRQIYRGEAYCGPCRRKIRADDKREHAARKIEKPVAPASVCSCAQPLPTGTPHSATDQREDCDRCWLPLACANIAKI